jgi:hypothetical protein
MGIAFQPFVASLLAIRVAFLGSDVGWTGVVQQALVGTAVLRVAPLYRCFGHISCSTSR